MDLSFTRFDRASSVAILPPDLAVLLVGVAARQAASPTARLYLQSARRPKRTAWFEPSHGCFNRAVAELLRSGRQMKTPFTEPL